MGTVGGSIRFDDRGAIVLEVDRRLHFCVLLPEVLEGYCCNR